MNKRKKIKALEAEINRINYHYRKMLERLADQSNRVRSIKVGFTESDDMHFVSSVYVHVKKGNSLCSDDVYKRYPPEHRFTKTELVTEFNNILATIFEEGE